MMQPNDFKSFLAKMLDGVPGFDTFWNARNGQTR